MQKISIIGGGAWGTALAVAAVHAGRNVTLWAREPEVVDAVNTAHENTIYLKGHDLPPALTATTNLDHAAKSDALLLVTPAQHLRSLAQRLDGMIRPGTPVAICSKGIEVSTGLLMSDVLKAVLPSSVPMILSGPTFASEVADGLPCALTLASEDREKADAFLCALAHPTFRMYLSDDIAGAQIGGAVKNVLAIATGMVAGLKLGENARAAVITRGLAEMIRFGARYGAKRETLMGLSGMGDLILTCSSEQSRNFSLGKAMGEGQTLKDIMARRNSVAEGAHTVDVVHRIATEHGIDMPITAAVYAIVKAGEDVGAVTEALMARPFTEETL